MIKKITFVFVVTVIVFVALAFWSDSNLFSFGREASLAKALSFPSTEFISSPKIESLKLELEGIARYELEHGCVSKNRFKEIKFCGDSEVKINKLHNELVEEVRSLERRNPEALALVLTELRRFSGNQLLEISFEGTSSDPYNNSGIRIEHYRDARGFEYWVNPNTNHVVQFGPGPNSSIEFAVTGNLSVTQLRQKAELFLKGYVDDFDWVKKNFVFRELIKSGNVSYVFRWQAKTGIDTISPFVQVVVSPQGEIMSFNDVRSLYDKK
jgi:hypothetical protein